MSRHFCSLANVAREPVSACPAAVPLQLWLSVKRTDFHNSSREAIFMRDHHRCIYCERALTVSGDSASTIDHVIPKSLFSTRAIANQDANRVACCHRCNSAKRDWRPTTLTHRAWFDREYCLKFIANCLLR